MTPGEYLRSSRDARRLTLEQVASAVDISIQYLSDIERGKRPPLRDRARLEALCEACGAYLVELDRLAAREGMPLDLADLTPDQREEVYQVALAARRSRAA